MTKPIEWREPATTETKTIPGDYLRLDVCRVPHVGRATLRPATPSDLVSALAAMGEGERAEVLRASGAAASFDMQTAIITDLRAKLRSTDAAWVESEKRFAAATARAEKAELERDDWKRLTGNERAWIEGARAILGTLPMETLHDAARRVVAERDSLRARLAASEQAERDEHAATIANLNASGAECRALREERDSLRSRLTAERDAARLELRALEWLHNESAFENGLAFRRGGHLWTLGGAWERGAFRDRETEHESYAAAARALGWEG